jgi:lysophospholipase L1-like esterase
LLLIALLSACARVSTRSGPVSPSAQTATHQLVYVALGASDGVGVGTNEPARDNWPTVLARELGNPVRFVNLGIAGATVAEATQCELPAAITAQPDVVTVWLAVNDLATGVSLSEYTNQLRALLHTLRVNTHARVYVGNVPDFALLPAARRFDQGAIRGAVAQWNAAIANAARAEGATVVDLSGDWQDLAQHPEYISADGFHPSTAGARRLAQLFGAAIARR